MNPRLRHALPWLVVAVFGLWGRFCYGPAMKTAGDKAGAERVRAAFLESAGQRETALRQQQDAQVATLTAELAKWQQIKQRTVTQWRPSKPDTVPGPERVVAETVTVTREPTVSEILEQANRTINACQLALGTCDQRIRNLLLALDSTTASRDYWKGEARPSLWRQLKQLPGRAATSTALMGAGYMACKLTGDHE